MGKTEKFIVELITIKRPVDEILRVQIRCHFHVRELERILIERADESSKQIPTNITNKTSNNSLKVKLRKITIKIFHESNFAIIELFKVKIQYLIHGDCVQSALNAVLMLLCNNLTNYVIDSVNYEHCQKIGAGKIDLECSHDSISFGFFK